jgi:hypothetical protein
MTAVRMIMIWSKKQKSIATLMTPATASTTCREERGHQYCAILHQYLHYLGIVRH